jgi:hypothetical protein
MFSCVLTGRELLRCDCPGRELPVSALDESWCRAGQPAPALAHHRDHRTVTPHQPPVKAPMAVAGQPLGALAWPRRSQQGRPGVDVIASRRRWRSCAGFAQIVPGLRVGVAPFCGAVERRQAPACGMRGQT